MCGICGIVAFHPDSDRGDRHERTASMLERLAHRGPDGPQLVTRPNAVFAANRLAIRSLGDDLPPLLETETGVLAVCNGEIDNHRELRAWLQRRGHRIKRVTDVAVIPSLYQELGLEFVQHLQGVFALCLWDPSMNRLIMARDRGGERHLYYNNSGGRICFASELSALQSGLAEPPQLDRNSIASYLRSGYYSAPHSAFSGVSKVRPGEMVVFTRHSTQHHRYWNCPMGSAPKEKSGIRDFDTIFRRAVERQSDIDVDYGVLLSGGVDSALVAAVARSIRPDKQLTAYTVRFSETSFDEGQQAIEVADRLGLSCISVEAGAKDVPDTLRDLIATTGEPLADPAWIPLSLLARRASRDVRFVLAGEGADELFGGYPTYLGAHLGHHYAKLPQTARNALRKLILSLPVSDRKVTLSFLLKRFVQGHELNGLDRHLQWTANIQPELLQRLGITPPGTPANETQGSLIDRVQRYDFEYSLPEALMAKADRGGMRHALEIRAPFLDQSVIEFAATLPIRQRIHGITTKAFLKRYALQYLPRSVVHRRKRGLSVPLASWLRGPLHDWARSRLTLPLLHETGIDSSVAVDLLEEHCQRVRDHSRALWTLIVLSEWLEWAQQKDHRQKTQDQAEVAAL